jgi:lipopolysaccharide/colanic/teichoic acid biosynthesis glycosyltransferase
MENKPFADKIYSKVLKRLFDFSLSLIGVIIFLPLFLIIIIFIKLDSKGQVIFKQERIGANGKKFIIFKFRSMRVEAEKYMEKPEESFVQITRTGKFLRHRGLDELPQIFNVLKGEMSLVGPRPELPFIAEGYSAFQKQRLSIKPGITGLWQISGKTGEPIHHNLEYDLAYLEHVSFALDIKILFKTLIFLLKGGR